MMVLKYERKKYMGEIFVKSGKIDPKYHKMLNEAFKKRQMADYRMYENFMEEIAIEQLKNAESFLGEIKNHLI